MYPYSKVVFLSYFLDPRNAMVRPCLVKFFLRNLHCSISVCTYLTNIIGSKDSSPHFRPNCAISFYFRPYLILCIRLKIRCDGLKIFTNLLGSKQGLSTGTSVVDPYFSRYHFY